jgi:hypothetical protein
VKIDLDKSDEEIVGQMDDLKELQQFARKLFLLREAAYQRRLKLQVEISAKLQEEQKLQAEADLKKIQEEHERRAEAEKKELKDAVLEAVKKLKEANN